MKRIYNFSAGPSTLPLAVLEEIGREISNYKGSGLSVMEMSHRSSAYMEIHAEAKSLLRELMTIPENYDILFLQGGATTQFASIPLNFLSKSGKADYILSGNFSKKAYDEATKYGDIKIIASSEEDYFAYVPKITEVAIRADAAYVHMCTNNTIYGTRYRPDELPNTGSIPLIADMSSNILSENYDINKFGMIYAGAQKNIGPAGLTVVILRKDLLDEVNPLTPTMLNYATQASKDSMYNTPPTFSIYVASLVFKWLKEKGGIEKIETINKRKAQKLYDFIDNSTIFKGLASPENRSLMNVTFKTDKEETDFQFIKQAEQAGLYNLKGHRLVGGMRASIYNAMSEDGVNKLIDVMTQFENKNK